MAMPALFEIGGSALVPSYYVGKLWPNSSGTPDVAGGITVSGCGMTWRFRIRSTR